MYDGSNFIKSSVNLGKPVVYVAVNYRYMPYSTLFSALADTALD